MRAGGQALLPMTSTPCDAQRLLRKQTHHYVMLCFPVPQLYEGYEAAYTSQVEGAGEGALAPGALVPAKSSFKLAAEVALLVGALFAVPSLV
jgi:hypothetical protein